MRRVVLLAVALALVLPATAGASATTGRLLVSLAPSAPDRAHASAARAVVARAAARAAGHAVPEIGMVTVRPRRGGSLRALAARLRRDPAVRAVSVERVATLRELPSDPALTTPQTPGGPTWQWWAERSGFPVAWDRTHGDAATVAVIDSGIDANHPEFAGRVRGAAAWVADPDARNPGVDESGHGTHVASLACGNAGNWFGIAGAGHSCGLIVEKTDLSDSSVVRAIVDATDRGADIINMSFGVDDRQVPPQALVDALDYAWNRDVVLVAAAADSATAEQGDPANVLQPTGTGPDLAQGRGLSVTAVGPDDRRASFAGFGSQISMAAYGAELRPGPAADGLLGAFPGTPTRIERGSLQPAVPPCRCRTTFLGDSRYAVLEGTSMAAPVVAGAAALVRSLNPDLRAPEVIRLLKETARRPEGRWTPDLGWGILDAAAATAAASLIDRRAPTSAVRTPRVARGTRMRLRLRFADAGPLGVVASGVRVVRVFRSTNGGPAKRIASTRKTTMTMRIKRGRRYAFFTQAVDRAGNVEPRPSSFDARTRVAR